MDNDKVVEHLIEIKTAVASLSSKLDSHLEEGKVIKSEIEDLKSTSNKGKGAVMLLSLINIVVALFFAVKQIFNG